MFLGALTMSGAIFFWVESEPLRDLEAREAEWGVTIQAGDLVFQDLNCGARCDLIENVTESRYTHVGIVLEENGERVVWEAYHPVGPTPLGEWVARGVRREIGIYRPRAPIDTDALRSALQEYEGRPYDGFYQWEEERIYCSELVALSFSRLGLEIAPEPISLGELATRIRALSQGQIDNGTMMVTPAALTLDPRFERIRDELVPQ